MNFLLMAQDQGKVLKPDDQTSESLKYEFILVAFLIYIAFFYLHDKAYDYQPNGSQNYENFEIKGYVDPDF